MAKLLFLGQLEDIAGAPDLTVPLQGPTTLADILLMLPPILGDALSGPKVKLALNGTLVTSADLILIDADELAFLPPVSGG